MPTWPELKTYAKSKYVLDDDGDDDFSLIFEFEIPLHALAHVADELEAHYAASDDF